MKAKTNGAWLTVASAAVIAFVFVSCRQAAVEAAYPVEKAKVGFFRGLATRISGAYRGAKASAESARLKREVAALAVLRSDLDSLEAENARLRKVLDYRNRMNGRWIPAEVLSFGGGASGSGKTIRVAKGSFSGISEGAIAAVPEGLVGLVTSVTPHTSEVTLVSDGKIKVSCEIETASGERPRGIIAGGTDDILILRYLTNADRIAPRARVVTSGLGGVFPKGLEIGTLLDVRTDERGLAREGEVQPSVDCSSLEDIFIRREE